MVCEKCGAINRDTAAACIVCGHRFPYAPPSPRQPAGAAPMPGQPPVQGRPPVQRQQPMQGRPPVPPAGFPQTPQVRTTVPNTKSSLPMTILCIALAIMIMAVSIFVVILSHSLRTRDTVSTDTADVLMVTIAGNIDDNDETPDDSAADDIENIEDPDARAYAEAAQLEDDGSYREAAEAFSALGDYQDSADRALECSNYADYNDALAALDDGNKAEAFELFTALGDFEDSEEQLEKCGLDLPDSAAEEMDTYFRDTLESTYNGSDWKHDTLSDMELLGRYELISKDGDESDNYVYLLYKVTGSNNSAGSMTYYWFGCYEDVTVSDTGKLSFSGRDCFTNDAGSQYKLYINGSGSYYYYGFKTVADFEADRINDLLDNYYCIWISA